MPADRWVIDASVLAAAFFEEAGTLAARQFLSKDAELTAPSLLTLEIASIAAKKSWKGLASAETCERAVLDTRRIVALVEPGADLTFTAFRLARDHRFSAYDASYLALADALSCTMVTLDERLIDRAKGAGLSRLVALLPGFQPGQP